MAIEQADIRVVRKPWGSTDLLPWSDIQDDSGAIGELWCQRPGTSAIEPALLLKLLFTTQPLSIQVHPDDAFAQSIGLEHGKTEAWYILSASPDACVALGLKRHLDATQLRASIEDGSISQLVKWRSVQKDDVIFVPAGTIHTIGAGIVLAEIQQRSDTTFRLFDYGRQRRLDVDDAVASSNREDPAPQPIADSLSDTRTLLVADPHFILERIDLAANTQWEMKVEQETWLFVLDGHAQIGWMNAGIGKAFFLDAADARIGVGPGGLSGLVAYPGPRPQADLLRLVDSVPADGPRSDFLHPAIVPRAAVQRKEIRV
ncbi:class I mannose-6-phosphate isomerase [Labrys portucalensis]|uniref:Class I mannose-6-phosphate isomerase n=1 Tax=Labrys neptuniae TaxID=376174 RepID=A0ABV6ZQH8_9HYPH